MFVVAGVDPGLTGAIVLLGGERGEKLLDVHDMPVWREKLDNRRGEEVFAGGLASILGEWKRRYPELEAVVYERVSAAPGQGVASTFKLGQSMGIVEGVIAACDLEPVRAVPHVWKAAMRLGSDKNMARQAAMKVWPACADQFARVADHGRAEAALIALWGIRSGAVEVPEVIS